MSNLEYRFGLFKDSGDTGMHEFYERERAGAKKATGSENFLEKRLRNRLADSPRERSGAPSFAVTR